MRTIIGFHILVGVSMLAGPAVTDAGAQSQAQTHISHILEGFGSAPDGEGLLTVATAEAATAAQHAQLAAGDPTNIDPMIRHARHVLHAVDPSSFPSGPGEGYGVGPAADGIAQHVELAAGSDGASEGVRTHAAHVTAAAGAVSRRASEIIDLANRIVSASVYNEAYPLVQQLQLLCDQLVTGADSSGDGEIGLSEGGLEHVRAHMGLMTSTASLR